MKPKNLIPLVVIVAILAGIVIYRQATYRTPSIVEQTRLVRLAPEGLSKSDFATIELYQGRKPEEKLVLAFDSGADKWRVSTHFNAPVKKDTIDKYLDAMVKMKGEPRATAGSEADLEQYNLTDAKALHVVGYKKEATEPTVHYLVGKSPEKAYRTVFMRAAGSNDVFVEETNLRQMAGIYDDTPPPKTAGEKEEEKEVKKPEPGTWLDKEIMKVDTAKMTKLALTLPDKSLVFERREKPKPEQPAEPPAAESTPAPPAPAASGEDETNEESAPPAEAKKPEAKPEYEWVLASGGAGLKLKPNGIDNFTKKFAALTGNDVVDPSKKADWGLEKPVYSCVISLEGQPDIHIEGGRPKGTGDGYVRLADAKEDLVYTLSSYTFEQIFPKGSELFEMPALSLDKKTLQSIELTAPESRIALAKEGETWKVATPVVDLKPQSTTLDGIASGLAAWKPEDYADADPGLGEPKRVATFKAGDQTHTIKLYTDSTHIDGAYARLDDADPVLVMKRMDVNKVFMQPKDLFVRTLLDIQESKIAEIHATTPAGAFSLARQEQNWTVTVNGTTSDGAAEACNDLAEAVCNLQASDVLFGQKELREPADSVLRVKMSAGAAEHVLTFGPEKDGKRSVKVSRKGQVLVVDQSDVAKLFPAVDKLKKAEAPVPEAAPAAAPGAAPEAQPPSTPEPVPALVPEAAPEPATEVAPAPVPTVAPAVITPTPPAPPVVVTAPAPPEPAPTETAPEAKPGPPAAPTPTASPAPAPGNEPGK